LLKTTIATIGGRFITDPEGARGFSADDFDVAEFVRVKVEEIRGFIGVSKAAIATSGGVDSTACAALVHRALGERLICFFMDTGFMREGEVDEVVKLLESLGLPLKVLSAKDRFIAALKGKTDAESKRLAFREAFYTILGEAVKVAGCEILVQGTIAPDWIETSGGIKTQHNVL
jgi:GMP synthase (glutamine-hydrolysing)